MIRKLIFVFAVALCAASCMDSDQTYSASYTLATTFEYGSVFKSDSLYFENQVGTGLGWQDMGFYHKLDEDRTEFYGGFILSRLKGSATSDQDRFRVNSGAGYGKSNNYVVYYVNPDPTLMPKDDIEFISKEIGTCKMYGCYVNNTKEVLNAIKESFVDGDRYAVKMTGYLGGEKTGSQEFVLAEYTEAKDSLVTSWSPFDLNKLGQIDKIDIEVISTRNDIPKAFCMDDMVAKVSIAY